MVLVGVIHVQAAREICDLGEVRVRVEKHLNDGLSKGGVAVDVLVQVEKAGEQSSGYCWCGGIGDIGGGGDTGTRNKGPISASCDVGLPPAQPVGLGLYGPFPGPDGEELPADRVRDKAI